MKRIVRALVAGVALLLAGLASAQEINFGIISTDKSAAIKSLWDPFIEDMQKQTGLKVNAFFATDYTGIIEAQRFNKIQVAWYGNKSAIEAVDRANGEVFAQFIDLQLDPCHPFHLNSQFAVNILDVPVHSGDKPLAPLTGGGCLGASRTLGTACAGMSGCTHWTCLTRQSSSAIRTRYPWGPGRAGDSPFTARPLF